MGNSASQALGGAGEPSLRAGTTLSLVLGGCEGEGRVWGAGVLGPEAPPGPDHCGGPSTTGMPHPGLGRGPCVPARGTGTREDCRLPEGELARVPSAPPEGEARWPRTCGSQPALHRSVPCGRLCRPGIVLRFKNKGILARTLLAARPRGRPCPGLKGIWLQEEASPSTTTGRAGRVGGL